MAHKDQSCEEFFDSIASKWDTMEDPDELAKKLDTGLESFGIHADEHVLDVGCGTGNLTAALVRKLSSKGRITAIDLSSQMLAIAKKKLQDPRINWLHASMEDYPFEKEQFDRVVCFSVWPHFINRNLVAKQIMDILKPGGYLHIWHLKSK